MQTGSPSRTTGRCSADVGHGYLVPVRNEGPRPDVERHLSRAMKQRRGALVLLLALATGAVYAGSRASGQASNGGPASPLPPRFHLVEDGPDEGSVWEGRIPNPWVRDDRRSSAIYLPPRYTTSMRYPVLYLLHGFWGSPSSFVDSFRIADDADELISSSGAAVRHRDAAGRSDQAREDQW